MTELAKLIKTAVRPFIITWGCVVYGLCILTSRDIPDLLAWLVSAVIIEYFGERAVLRFKGKSDNSKRSADEDSE